MKNKMFMLAAALVLFSTTAPVLADGGPASLLGASTAFVIDVPQGIVVDSLYYVPKKTSKSLAIHFGDEHGLLQNIVGLAIGVPAGMIAGVPYGALHGAKHGLGTGWEKPFSTESYIVTEEK